MQIGVILIEDGLLVNEEYTFTRLLNFHTITQLSHDYSTFTRLPLTFTRILLWELSGKEQKKQKCPGGKLLRQGILHIVIV